jgi:hypothetical protein
MKLHRLKEASEFYNRVKDYLLSQQALHSSLLAVCNILIRNRDRFAEKLYLATVEVDGNIVAQALYAIAICAEDTQYFDYFSASGSAPKARNCSRKRAFSCSAVSAR